MHFPSCRYHRTLPPCIVQDQAEDEALGEGWAHTPAAFEADEPVPTPVVTTAKPAKTRNKA